jgi:primosomal protein N''
MKPSVYIETAIPSYLTASHNPSLLMAAHQEATRNWWDTARFDYDLFISEFVMAECASGNADAAERRLAAIQNLPELDISSEVEPLAQQLLAGAALPEKAKLDALHICGCHHTRD